MHREPARRLTADPETLDRFSVVLDVVIRYGVARDLPELEWSGLFTEHREIIRAAFEAQKKGYGLMLVADWRRFPVGQAWVDLTDRQAESTAVFWAVRVHPALRRAGIGTRLIAAAERAAARRGFRYAELGVEKDNPDARRLYERLGYRPTAERLEEYSYTTPDGVPMRVPVDQWILRKAIRVQGGKEQSDG